MTIEEFKALFPLKARVTKEMISKANLSSINNCIGAKTLKSIFPNNKCTWGNWCGSVVVEDEQILLTTIDNIEVMDIVEPQEITFILFQYGKQ